jgi:peptidoglycan hydrolase CwlO-like protein
MPEDLNSNANPTPNPGEDNSNRDVAPQWARDAITKGNNEAAKYRTDLRTKTEEHTAALTEIAGLKDSLTTAQASESAAKAELLKLSVALAAGIPGDKAAAFAARLQGATEEELKADAESLKGVFPTEVTPSATDPSQGRGASTPVTPESAFGATLKGLLDPMIRP